MYYVTWVFQFLTLLLGNMGFILLGGKALKVRDDKLRSIETFPCNPFYMHFDGKIHVFKSIYVIGLTN